LLGLLDQQRCRAPGSRADYNRPKTVLEDADLAKASDILNAGAPTPDRVKPCATAGPL
jgi:hypothetical protein